MEEAETEEKQMIRELERDVAERVLETKVENRDKNQKQTAEEWQE